VIGTDRWRSEPPCVRKGVPHGQTESGGIVLAVVCWSPCAVLPDRALCSPTFSHFLIVNKTSPPPPPPPPPPRPVYSRRRSERCFVVSPPPNSSGTRDAPELPSRTPPVKRLYNDSTDIPPSLDLCGLSLWSCSLSCSITHGPRPKRSKVAGESKGFCPHAHVQRPLLAVLIPVPVSLPPPQFSPHLPLEHSATLSSHQHSNAPRLEGV
jgi:hypothetical protein